jgi:hypothetical protein
MPKEMIDERLKELGWSKAQLMKRLGYRTGYQDYWNLFVVRKHPLPEEKLAQIATVLGKPSDWLSDGGEQAAKKAEAMLPTHGRRARPWLRRTVWLPLFLATVGCGVSIQSSRVARVSSDECQPVPVRLVGQERVQRSRGHADSRFGVHGQDSYAFDGVAHVADERLRLRMDDAAPIAAFSTDDRPYLLAQRRFGPEWLPEFLWLSSKDGALQPVTEADIPPSCPDLRLSDPVKDRQYKLWRVRQALRTSPTTGCHLFTSMARANPRFAFQPQPPENRPDTLLPDLLDEEVLPRTGACDQEGLGGALRSMLERSKDSDWGQDVRFVARALLRIEGREVIPYLIELRGRFRAEERSSSRADAVEEVLKYESAQGVVP